MLRGVTEGNERAEDAPLVPFRCGARACSACPFEAAVERNPGNPGGLFSGVVSSRYGCSRHSLLVRRASGSYFNRSAMHSTSLMGTERSNRE